MISTLLGIIAQAESISIFPFTGQYSTENTVQSSVTNCVRIKTEPPKRYNDRRNLQEGYHSNADMQKRGWSRTQLVSQPILSTKEDAIVRDTVMYVSKCM